MMMATLLIIIPIKQLSGYSYWHTVWRIVAALIPFFGLANRRSPHSVLCLARVAVLCQFHRAIPVCTNQNHLVLIPVGFRRLGGIY